MASGKVTQHKYINMLSQYGNTTDYEYQHIYVDFDGNEMAGLVICSEDNTVTSVIKGFGADNGNIYPVGLHAVVSGLLNEYGFRNSSSSTKSDVFIFQRSSNWIRTNSIITL